MEDIVIIGIQRILQNMFLKKIKINLYYYLEIMGVHFKEIQALKLKMIIQNL